MAGQYFWSIMLFNLLILSAGTLIYVKFLYDIYRTLRLIRIRNRQFTPSMVWLCLIPFVGIFVAIFMVTGVAGSIRTQLKESARIQMKSSHGIIAGRIWIYPILIALILEMVGFGFDLADVMHQISQCCLLVSFVAWIVYWTQINSCRQMLLALRGNDYTNEELDYGDDLKAIAKDE